MWFVLVGGEAAETQGAGVAHASQRELLHTSCAWVGRAFAALRRAGVPRSRIIVVAQVADYLDGPVARGVPAVRDAAARDCTRLLAEGGADYDGERCNPATVWRVLLGLGDDANHAGAGADAGAGAGAGAGAAAGVGRPRYPRVVPRDSGEALMVAFYSHGDSHAATAAAAAAEAAATAAARQRERERDQMMPVDEPLKIDYATAEFFLHFPYPSPSEDGQTLEDMTEFVAVDAASSAGYGRNKPMCYLYASQLRAIFARLFAAQPARPVFCLVNACRSGGFVEFLRRPHARTVMGADAWPLFLAASSQAEKDALVGGVWEPWFDLFAARIAGADGLEDPDPELAAAVRAEASAPSSASAAAASSDAEDGSGGGNTVADWWAAVTRQYFTDSVYELRDIVVSFAYASNFGEDDDSWAADLRAPLVAGPGGAPDESALRALQRSYKDKSRFGRRVYVWNPTDWKNEVDLVECVRLARKRVALPEHGIGTDRIMDTRLHDLFARRTTGSEE